MMLDIISPDYENSDLSFIIVKATAIVLRSPITTPVQTSFGTMTNRPAVFLLLVDAQGNTGESWCNFPACGAEHRQRLLGSAILPALLNKEYANPQHCYHALQAQFKRLAMQAGEQGPIAQCIAAVDIALWDLVAKRLSLPLHKLLGSENATIGVYASGLNPTDGVDNFMRCQDEGFTAFKLKIGFGDEIDYPNIERICAKQQPGEQLMVDANPNPLRQRMYSPNVENGQTTLSDKPGLGVDLDELDTLQNDPTLLGGQ